MDNNKFELITSSDQLENSNSRVGESSYRDIAPNRSVIDDLFPNGAIRYDWSLASDHYFDPQSVRIVTDIDLTNADGNQLEVADEIAFMPGVSAQLFDRAEFYMGDELIEDIDNIPEVNQIIHRGKFPNSWIGGNGAGVEDNWRSIDQRIADVSSDGATAGGGGGGGGTVPVENGIITIPRLENAIATTSVDLILAGDLPSDFGFIFTENSSQVDFSTSDPTYDLNDAFNQTDMIQVVTQNNGTVELIVQEVVDEGGGVSSIAGLWEFEDSVSSTISGQTLFRVGPPIIYTSPSIGDGEKSAFMNTSTLYSSSTYMSEFFNFQKNPGYTVIHAVKIASASFNDTWQIHGTRSNDGTTNARYSLTYNAPNFSWSLQDNFSTMLFNVNTAGTFTMTANRTYWFCFTIDYNSGGTAATVDMHIYSRDGLEYTNSTVFNASTLNADIVASGREFKLNGSKTNAIDDDKSDSTYDNVIVVNRGITQDDAKAISTSSLLGSFPLDTGAGTQTSDRGKLFNMTGSNTSSTVTWSGFTPSPPTDTFRSDGGSGIATIGTIADSSFNGDRFGASDYHNGFTYNMFVETSDLSAGVISTLIRALYTGILIDSITNELVGFIGDTAEVRIPISASTQYRVQFRVDYVRKIMDIAAWDGTTVTSNSVILTDTNVSDMVGLVGGSDNFGLYRAFSGSGTIDSQNAPAGTESSTLRIYTYAIPEDVTDWGGSSVFSDYAAYIDSLLQSTGTRSIIVNENISFTDVGTSLTRYRDALNITYPLTGATVTGAGGGAPVKARELKNFQFVWKPPLGIFHSKKYIPGGTKFSLRLYPSNKYKINAVQSKTTDKIPGVDYLMNIKQQKCNVHTFAGPQVDGKYLIDYWSVNSQSQVARQINNDVMFTVSPSTYQFAVCNNPLLGSTLYPRGIFISENNSSKSINELLARYSTLKYPQNGSIRPTYIENDVDKRMILYSDTYQTWDNKDPEPYEYWSDEYGQYYSFVMIKDATDLSETFTLTQQFNSAPTNMKTMVFAIHSKVAEVSIDNRIVNNINVSNS